MIVKTASVSIPLAGTLPAPVQPVQTQRVPLVSSAGEETVLVMTLPGTKWFVPYPWGVGEPKCDGLPETMSAGKSVKSCSCAPMSTVAAAHPPAPANPWIVSQNYDLLLFSGSALVVLLPWWALGQYGDAAATIVIALVAQISLVSS